MRIGRVLAMLALAMLGSLFASGPASAATTRTIRGTVACENGNKVVGIWVQSSAGGSKWSDTLTLRPGASWVADYSVALATPTTSTDVELHIGCGGDQTTWWSTNLPQSPFKVTGNGEISALCKEAQGRGRRCNWWFNTVLVGMPFTGYWDRFGTSPPNSHGNETPNSVKDWATDIYATSGATNYLRLQAPLGKTLTVRLINGGSCTGVCSVGVNAQIEVLLNGVSLGWVKYGHLKDVPATVGSNGAVLGKLNLWPWNDTYWRVGDDSGVHTHLSMYNTTGYSCYWPLASKTKYLDGRLIGKLGGTGASAVNSACPS